MKHLLSQNTPCKCQRRCFDYSFPFAFFFCWHNSICILRSLETRNSLGQRTGEWIIRVLCQHQTLNTEHHCKLENCLLTTNSHNMFRSHIVLFHWPGSTETSGASYRSHVHVSSASAPSGLQLSSVTCTPLWVPGSTDHCTCVHCTVHVYITHQHRRKLDTGQEAEFLTKSVISCLL